MKPLLDQALDAYARQNLVESQSAFKRVLLRDPDNRIAQSYLLQLAFYDEASSGASRLAAHQLWSRQFPPERLERRRHAKPRIGYVSLAFRRPPWGTFLQPILAAHDYTVFDFYGYASAEEIVSDGPFNWRDVAQLTPDAISQQIRSDGIDILVNLDGHADAATMEAFARRAAPIQVSLPVYPGSTGLSTVDFRFTDRYADPAPGAAVLYSEELRYLPAFLPYQPEPCPPVENSPFERHGFVTFGVFGNPIKIGPYSLDFWARVLARSPRSRLAFHHPLLAGSRQPGRTVIDPDIRRRICEPLLRAGVTIERLAFVGGLEWRDHMDFYNEVDVLLDTYPYSGCTTTCEALWMGVPSLSYKGACFVERMSSALLHQVGLEWFCDSDWAVLEERAVHLAMDAIRLREARRTLRDRMTASALLDVHGWVRALESNFIQLLRDPRAAAQTSR